MNKNHLFLSIDIKLDLERLNKTLPCNIKKILDDIIENSYIEPYNDSIEEIISLENIINSYTDDERISFANKFNHFFTKFTEINKTLKVDIKKLIDPLRYVVYILKIKFNRLRPFELSQYYNKQIYMVALSTIYTPSYPSGHSSIARFLYRYFSDKDPKNDKKYFELMHNISLSRILAGVHFKSDCEQSIPIADLVYDRLKREKLLE